jgi:hypothetical protein
VDGCLSRQGCNKAFIGVVAPFINDRKTSAPWVNGKVLDHVSLSFGASSIAAMNSSGL